MEIEAWKNNEDASYQTGKSQESSSSKKNLQSYNCEEENLQFKITPELRNFFPSSSNHLKNDAINNISATAFSNVQLNYNN